MKMKWLKSTSLGALLLVVCLALSPALVHADFTLTDGTSVAVIDPNSQAGMYSWRVQNQDYLFQQWFWYATGSGANQTAPLAINQIGAPVAMPYFGTRGLDLLYTAGNFTIETTYLLTGSAGRVSDIAETIRIRNTSTQALPFHFYQYSDFDLPPNLSNNFAVHVNDNTIHQTNGTGTSFQETVTTTPSHWQIGPYATILAGLNGGVAYNLTDTATGVQPYDVTYAFQWDYLLAPGEYVLISKDKLLTGVPVPPSALLLGSGLLGLLFLRRRKA